MKSEKIVVDRGIQLDQMRLRGEFVDVRFVVDGKTIPAHRFIVGLHSPFLRMLTLENASQTSGPTFVDCGQDEIELKGIDSRSFELVVTYLYTGLLTLTEENVFSIIETCQFLQIEDKYLTDSFGKYLRKLIQGGSQCSLEHLLRVWCLAEQYSWDQLREAVLSVIDAKLEVFLHEDMFSFLGFEEIKAILQRPTLCVRSEKNLFNAIINWSSQKVSIDDQESLALVSDLFQLLKLKHLNKNFVLKSLENIGIERSMVSFNRSEKRSCNECAYLTLFSKSEQDIRGIDEFLEQRKSELEFSMLEFDDLNPRWTSIPSLTKTKTYFHHYGPHEGMRNATMVTTDAELFVLGCQKNAFFSSIDALSNDIKVFDYESQSWRRCVATLPLRLTDFVTTVVGNTVFILGGLTDGLQRDAKNKYSTRALSVSTLAFKINLSVLKSSVANSKPTPWVQLATMPSRRAFFTTASTDQKKIFTFGNDFCDAYNIDSDSWESIPTPFNYGATADLSSANFSPKKPLKPVAATLGSAIYVFGIRPPAEGVNPTWILDTCTLTWSRLEPALELRYDPQGAFSHNGLIYLLGWQAATNNFVNAFDPQTKKWSHVVKNMNGNFVPHGIIVRKTSFSA